MNDETMYPLTDEELDAATGGARYINYGALARGRSSVRGTNPTNPYSRGCSAATRCRS